MAHPLDDAEVLRLARLANLALAPEEAAIVARDLTGILEHMDVLAAAEALPAEAEDAPVGALRADLVLPSLPHDEALAEAPRHDGRGFAVAGFVDEG